jgi:hypothetical protein
MPQPIEQLIFSAFDVHVSAKPLADPGLFAPGARFLADLDAYRKLAVAAQSPDLPHFRVFPLKGELGHNHFWRQFEQARAPVASGVHDFLLPLRCRPKSFVATVRVPPMPTPVSVRATVWLWPFAWSSLVEFSFRAPLSLNDLCTISEGLRSDPPPFTLAAAPTSLSGIFKFLTDSLLKDITAPGKAISPPPAVSRHVVLAAFQPVNAPLLGYRSRSMPKQWSDADRALMHRVLLGRPVPIWELAERERRSAFLLTEFAGGKSFALTDFSRGSLLMLRPVSDKSRRRDRVRCLAANLRHCSLAGLALTEAIHGAKRFPVGNSTLDDLAKTAADTLENLPDSYPNPFCRAFLEENSRVQRARSALQTATQTAAPPTAGQA